MREVYESIRAALVRYFDSKAITASEHSDEVFWLRTQLAIKDQRIKELTDQLTTELPKEVEPEYTVPQPVLPRNPPWHVTQRKLEREDHLKFQKMKEEMEAQKLTVVPQSTEQLEAELLGEAAK